MAGSHPVSLFMVDQQPAGRNRSHGRPDHRPSVVLGWTSAFGRFWWDFLIGDTPELFVGAAAIIGVLALVSVKPGLRTVAAFLAPVLVAGVLTASLFRAARRRTP
jgi:hypothetical protein